MTKILLCIVAGIYAVFSFLIFLIQTNGKGFPDIIAGKYVIHDHGFVKKEISQNEYVILTGYVERWMSSLFLIFSSIPMTLFYSLIKSKKSK